MYLSDHLCVTTCYGILFRIAPHDSDQESNSSVALSADQSNQEEKDSGSRCGTRSSPKGLSDQEAKDSGKSKYKVLTVL